MNDQATSQKASDQSPVLGLFHKRFCQENDDQTGLINQIEEKLHSILNRKTPQSEGKMEIMPSATDFMGSAEMELNRVINSNRRLSVVLEHLENIV